MNVSIYNPFAGPIRAEVMGVKMGVYQLFVTVKSICNARGYPRGYIFDAPYRDVYLNHRFIKGQTEYFTKPSLEDLSKI